MYRDKLAPDRTGKREAVLDKTAIMPALPRECFDKPATVEFFDRQFQRKPGPQCPRSAETGVYRMANPW
jgi:hypothetical protein